MDQLQSHIWLTASSYMGKFCAFPHILGSPSSYLTLQLLHSEFSYIYGENLILFFISVGLTVGRRWAARAGGSVCPSKLPLQNKSCLSPATKLGKAPIRRYSGFCAVEFVRPLIFFSFRVYFCIKQQAEMEGRQLYSIEKCQRWFFIGSRRTRWSADGQRSSWRS